MSELIDTVQEICVHFSTKILVIGSLTQEIERELSYSARYVPTRILVGCRDGIRFERNERVDAVPEIEPSIYYFHNWKGCY